MTIFVFQEIQSVGTLISVNMHTYLMDGPQEKSKPPGKVQTSLYLLRPGRGYW